MNDRLTQPIDRLTGQIKKEFGSLSVTQLNWKPNDRVWSIAQNIDHLIVVKESYYPVIKKIREGGYDVPWTGKINFLVGLAGKMILSSVQPDRRRKMKTFPVWEPSTGNIDANILSKFVSHQSELKNLIQSCSDLIEKGTVLSSPANRWIVYKLETAFDILVAHEQRHFEQAKELIPVLPA